MSNGPLISLVVPMLDEEDNVGALVDHLVSIATSHPKFNFELIAVDDGSTDATAERLREELPKLGMGATIVRLSRNFGSHYALTAGLDAANGDCAIAIGADLQEPIELITDFLDQWEKGFKVVWGIRRTRAIAGPRSWPSRGFSRLFARYSEIKTYPTEGPSGVLVDRRVIDAVAGLHERNRNVYGLIAWAGFKQSRVEYDQLPRAAGNTKWNTRGLIKLAFDSFVQFSSTPIRASGALGLVFAGLGFLYAIVLVVQTFFGIAPPEGWTTVVVLVLILGGIQLIALSIFGEYLWRATDEARRRPLYLVHEKIIVEPDDG